MLWRDNIEEASLFSGFATLDGFRGITEEARES